MEEEEMEEGAQSVIYDDYKFLTKEDLERLNLTSLIGTNLLRAYMHGFFIDYRLYKKAQTACDPFAYEAYIERRKQEKIEAERASRITIKRKLPKVNRLLAARLLENEEAEDGMKPADDSNAKKKSSKKSKGLTSDILKDDRFKSMFENKDFEVDEQSTEYQSLHPQSSKTPSLIEEHFKPLMEDEEQNIDYSDASTSESSEEESDKVSKKQKTSKQPRLYEVKDERHAEAFMNSVSLAEEDALPLGERVLLQEQQQHKASKGPSTDVKLGPGGSREISFISRSSKTYRSDGPREGKRRDVQSLGLKPGKSEFYNTRGGRGGRGRGGRGGRGRGRGRR